MPESVGKFKGSVDTATDAVPDLLSSLQWSLK